MSDALRFVVLPLDDDRAPEWARSDFGWFVHDRRHGAYVGDDQGEPEDKLLVRSGFSWVEQALNDVDKEAERTIADLRDRLSLFAGLVCRACGCAPYYVRQEHCLDCWEVRRNYHGIDGSGSHVSSCISVGLRALCGRRLLDGGEIQK